MSPLISGIERDREESEANDHAPCGCTSGNVFMLVRPRSDLLSMFHENSYD
ncbi:hypothetical protein KIN20_018643 [Parelaphostrongylus tenuis]|uniref:Uncharacterized protein n=1 Tax=Parelaphostrongylus tenuis TaxID=148309 RepID=A0AAD5QS95_PARTN|nr:hypothetical protein KIN20_018643 [Parelaphostrongylus tenuis]